MHKPILEQSHLLGANNEIQIIIIFIFVVNGGRNQTAFNSEQI